MAMQASSTEPSPALAALEDQCQNWLLRIELDITCSFLTLDAIQWALSALLAIQSSESLEAFISTTDLSLDVAGKLKTSEQNLGVSQGESSCGTSSALLDINGSPDAGEKYVTRTAVGVEHLEAPGKAGGAAQRKTSDVGGELQRQEESREFAEDTAKCVDEVGLAEEIRIADKGETGKRLAAVIEEKLATPGCSSLVKLIEHCLFISLGQETPGKIAIFLKDLKQPSGEREWLHAWLLKSLLSNSKLENSFPQRKNFAGCDLDWLLALLSAVNPDHYFVLLLDIVVAECFDRNAGTNVLRLLFVRIAAILEFVFLRYGEQAASCFISSYQLFEKILKASREESVQNPDEMYSRRQSYLINFWLSVGTLCPGFFSCCACLVVPTLDDTSVKNWWHLLKNWNLEDVPLLDLSKLSLGTNANEHQGFKEWLCCILLRRLAQLSSAAVDIVLLLGRLCNQFLDQTEVELSEAAFLLLKNLSQKLCQNIFPTISGDPGWRALDLSRDAHLFMENLTTHVARLWATMMMGQCFPSKSQTPHSKMRSVYEHPAAQICLLALLSSDAQAIAQVLVDSMVLIHSTVEEGNLSIKMEFFINVMKILAGKAENQLIFELWGHCLVDQIQMQCSDKASTRIFTLKKILESISMNTTVAVSSPQTVPEEGHESELELWLPARHYLLRALSKHWLSIFLLLYHDQAWEVRLMTLDILQHISPNESSNYQEIIGRLKIALGLFLWWLDKSYGSVDCGEERDMYLGLTWTDSDRKWRQTQLIEKFKCLIVQLASFKLMNFTLMANSLLDYSFQGMQRIPPESSVPRKFSKVSPMFTSCKSGRLNRYGRFEIPANKGFRSSATYYYHQENHRKESKGESIQKETLGIDILGKFSQTSLIAAQLGNLLRRAFAQISSQVGLSAKNETAPPQPSTVIARLLLDRLQTPHELPMTKEQYEEVLPKVISASRHIFVMSCFSKNPLLFEMLEIIVENGGESEALQCIEFIRALLADSISSWHNRSHVHKYITSSTKQDEEADRVQVCRLIQMIAIGGWLPKPLASSSEIVSLIDAEDMSDLLLLIWHCMHHSQETNATCVSSVQVATHDSAEGNAENDWEDQYLAILRKNVSKIGCHFSRVYPKGRT